MQSVSSKGQNAQHNCGIALQYTQFDVNSHKHSIRKETNILWPEFLFVIALRKRMKLDYWILLLPLAAMLNITLFHFVEFEEKRI